LGNFGIAETNFFICQIPFLLPNEKCQFVSAVNGLTTSNQHTSHKGAVTTEAMHVSINSCIVVNLPCVFEHETIAAV